MALLEDRDHSSRARASRAALIPTLTDTAHHYIFIAELVRLFLALTSPKDPMRLVSASISLNEAPS